MLAGAPVMVDKGGRAYHIATLSVYACVVFQILLGDGRVECVEALHLEEATLSTSLLISFCFIDFALSSKTDKKKK